MINLVEVQQSPSKRKSKTKPGRKGMLGKSLRFPLDLDSLGRSKHADSSLLPPSSRCPAYFGWGHEQLPALWLIHIFHTLSKYITYRPRSHIPTRGSPSFILSVSVSPGNWTMHFVCNYKNKMNIKRFVGFYTNTNNIDWLTLFEILTNQRPGDGCGTDSHGGMRIVKPQEG